MEAFTALGLSEPLVRALVDLGYEAPTPIQERAIPAMLTQKDMVGQAQTGTGKTAAFALPILQALDPAKKMAQALILVPTRELALQVAEAFHTYARHLGAVSVLPIYGGQPMFTQLRRLERGVHVVVGTPGRVMDHLRRGSLKLDALKMVVLDEADEMLRMGFLEDVEWILEQVPTERQVALFSATMPREIRRVAQKHLRDPVTVAIEETTLTVPTVDQRYAVVADGAKLDALTRLLETEPIDGVLVFARTRVRAQEVAEKLAARGLPAEPLHGEMSQAQRETVVRRIKDGRTDVVVATDVAARGLDVDRITHVVNYDAPGDLEAYVHRIGRTGRAGRAGVAILFVTPRERRIIRDIERHTGQKMTTAAVPTRADVAATRIARFKDRLRKVIETEDLDPYLAIVEELVQEGCDVAEIAAAAARVARGDVPLELEVEPDRPEHPKATPQDGMTVLFLPVGRQMGIRPGDIVGAIANEADVPGREIGSVDIEDRFTLVEVPTRYVDQVLQSMSTVTLRGRQVQVTVADPTRLPPRRGPGPDRRRGPPRGRRER